MHFRSSRQTASVSCWAFLAVGLFAGISGGRPAIAQNTPAQNAPVQFDTLAEQMSSPRSSERMQAARQLRQLGTKAHPMLRKMAESSDSETSIRAIELLQEASRSSDESISKSAHATLQAIADSLGPRSSMADDALNGSPPSSRVLPALKPLRQRVPQGGRRNLRINIKTINGVREIQVTENDRTFKFRDAGKGIETERPNGQGGVTRQTYKDAGEMKQRDPEAYEAFEKAGGPKRPAMGGGLGLPNTLPFGRNFPFGPGFIPQQIPRVMPPRVMPPRASPPARPKLPNAPLTPERPVALPDRIEV